MPENDHDRIVRLEEQIRAADNALRLQLDAERIALQLRTEELDRRLQILNHAHEQARERDSDFMPRELYESEHNLVLASINENRDRINNNQEKLSTLIATGAGSSKVVTNLLAIGALLVSVAVAIATIAYLATH